MRIAYISYEHPLGISGGGIGTYVAQISEIMSSFGHDVETFAATEEISKSTNVNGYKLHLLNTRNKADFKVAVRSYFKQAQIFCPFDLIECAEYNADASLIKEDFPTIPLIVKLHTPTYLISRLNLYKDSFFDKARYILAGLIKGKISKPYWRYDAESDPEYLLSQQAAGISSPSISLAKLIQEEWKNIVPPNHLANPFHPTKEFLDIPIELKNSKKIRVLFLGRLEKRKGVLDLMEAIPSILKNNSEVHFNFVGKPLPSPNKNQNMDAYIRFKLRKFENNVSFKSKVPYDEIPKIIRDADICIFPSIWENFPNVCLEAMSAGKAVVASNSGGMADMITNGINGLLIPPNSPKEITKSINFLISNPKAILSLGLAAREHVLKHYNRETIGQQTEAFYRAILSAVERSNKKQ